MPILFNDYQLHFQFINKHKIYYECCNIKICDLCLISENSLSIDSLNFSGMYNISSNKKYIIAVDGNVFILIRQNFIILKGIIDTPRSFQVSNSGMFLISSDIHYNIVEASQGLNRLYIISKDGMILFLHEIYSIILIGAISENSQQAIFITSCVGTPNIQNRLFLYDIEKNKFDSSFPLKTENIKKCVIDTCNKVLYIYYRIIYHPIYRIIYSIDGKILNNTLWNQYIKDQYSSKELLGRADYMLKNINSNLINDFSEPINILNLALRHDDYELTNKIHSSILYTLGNIYLKCECLGKARWYFEESLIYNPKISVKRVLKKIYLQETKV